MSFNPIPSGVVFQFGGTTAPEGYLLCDGSQVSRVTYAALYAAIGNAHGSGDGSTTFHLPDYRGRTLRGVDGGSARDPDAASRTAANAGGNTGNNVGSVQDDAAQRIVGNSIIDGMVLNLTSTGVFGEITNGAGRSATTVTGSARELTLDNSAGGTYKTSGTGSGDGETRSKNAYVNFIMKI